MSLSRRQFLGIFALTGASAALGGLGLSGCSSSGTDTDASGSSASSAAANVTTAFSSKLAVSSKKWKYDSKNDVYYQLGLAYCTNPVADDYESMGIYVPGAYFDGKKNGNGTYTCTVNSSNTVNGFTAETAPVVMPINTAGYSAQEAPTSYSYSGLGDYLKAGFVYVFAGCRGRDNGTNSSGNTTYPGGAPWGVTDLKAAVRTLRCNASALPGNMDRIFSLGMSGGGAQSALLGVSGDAAGYGQYLNAIGAPGTDKDGNTVSDAIFGSMCWCPITCLDFGSEAYEWNMGQFASSGTRKSGTFTKQLSQDMAKEWATYLNDLQLKDSDGNVLQLEESDDGIYLSGSYYDYVVSVIQGSLNNFLSDTDFPYTPSNETQADLGAGGGGTSTQAVPSGSKPSGSKPSSSLPSGSAPSGGSLPQAAGGASSTTDTTTYKTATAYIKSLNSDSTWITYDKSSNTATINGLKGFVQACKQPTKAVGAFDALDRSQGENSLFGTAKHNKLHFDATMASLINDNKDSYAKLKNWKSGYPKAFAKDLKRKDTLGNTSELRQDLYNPLYYLMNYYGAAGSSTPAANWRIRTGIQQGDTANTTDINLALALGNSVGFDHVDFETVWGKGHTTAERSGEATDNFISWVEDCCNS